MRKHYIIDTSVLIHDPNSFKSFTGNDVIIPVNVLDELDKIKNQPNEAGKNARVCIRALDTLCSKGDIHKGIKIENGILLKIETSKLPDRFGPASYVDNKILSCAYLIKEKNNKKKTPTPTILVSKDINLRVRARAFNIQAEDYEKDKTPVVELYQGFKSLQSVEIGLALNKKDSLDISMYDELQDLKPNECVHIESKTGDGIAVGRCIKDKLVTIKNRKPWGLDLRNKEQAFAVDMLCDPRIPLVSLIGKAGTGKTLCAIAAALEMVLEQKKYSRLIIYRPIQPVGNDIGFLPGPQPLDAKIMTPKGWSTMGDIQPNDFVIGSDGNAKKVLKIFPKGEKEVFKVTFSDGSSTECCDDHLWYTTSLQESQRKNGQGSVKSLREIRNTLKVYTSNVNNHKIPLVKSIEFAPQETIIEPYIMGILLGDGTLSEDYSVYFTSSDKQIMDECMLLLPSNMMCKIKSKVNNNYNYSFIVKENINNEYRRDNIFAREIKRLGLNGSKSGTKFIPNEYKINSTNARIAILQGLMDTDGFVSKDGADVSYSTTSDQLAKDVQFIVQSLGGIAKINKKKSKYSYNEIEKELISNVVSISLPIEICPFRLDKKINRFKYRKYPLHRIITDVSSIGIKKTKCILVESDDHLYTTDDFILTHNTMEEKLGPWMQAVSDSFEFLFEHRNGSKWKTILDRYLDDGSIQMEAITYIRGRSIPNAFILIDEAQNLSKEEVKTILTRAGTGTKIVLTGDIEQIDNSFLDATNNGLSYTVEKFKDIDLAGHITFTKGERSVLASKAAEIL